MSTSGRSALEPRVFIGSSREGLKVVRQIEEALSDIALVIPWTDTDYFTKPGAFFLDSLINASQSFDFAVLVFGADDIVQSRGKRTRAPRDNVIFELGLFMSTLQRERTIVVAPTVWRTGLKILSDLAGLTLAEYEPPARKRDLPTALMPIMKAIRDQISEVGPNLLIRGPGSVGTVCSELVRYLRRTSDGPRTIQNLALDMEHTWSCFISEILPLHHKHGLELRVLMLDHQAPVFRRMSSSSVSVKMARLREEGIQRFLRSNHRSLEDLNIRLECRAYNQLPPLHGFLVDSRLLHVSMCSVEGGRLIGEPNPYTSLVRPSARLVDRTGAHIFDVFESWFEFLWKKSRSVWPIEGPRAGGNRRDA